jgi:DNA-directed RNA polymerase subunit RPC12/RpoP
MDKTIREYVQQRVWYLRGLGSAIGGAAIFGSMALVDWLGMGALGLVIGVVVIVAIVQSTAEGQIRCPSCEHRLGRKAGRIAFALIWKVKRCPYCGVDLDQRMPLP